MTTQNGSNDWNRKVVKLAALVNKHRLANGWSLFTQEQCQDMAPVWIEILDAERIPVGAYDDLYTKAMHRIARVLADGKKAPEFNATLLTSVWLGDSELQWKHYPRPSWNAISGEVERCQHCLGTGWEYVKESFPREVARCRCGKVPGRKF
jgi:hypothetical protein